MSAHPDDDMEMEPGSERTLVSVPGAVDDHMIAASASSSVSGSGASSSSARSERPTLLSILFRLPLNSYLSTFLPTRDLFNLQFLSRHLFTLLNSTAELLVTYYSSTRLNSFIPYCVNDEFIKAFCTPNYLTLADGSTAVRNTYSMHIQHLYLNFCTRISNVSLQVIGMHIGKQLLTLNLEGGGRSRINEQGMRGLFQSCRSLTSLNLNGFYQLNMVETITSMMQSGLMDLKELYLNGCSQMNEQAIMILCRGIPLSVLPNTILTSLTHTASPFLQTGYLPLKLRVLHLNCSNITDIALQTIAQALKDGLQVLHVGYNGHITDRGLAALCNSCRNLTDLNLYGCYGLGRHSLACLRLCPLLQTVDISRIHTLDDSSIAEWILPQQQLQYQQALLLQQQHTGATGANTAVGATPAEYNPHLPQIFAAQNALLSVFAAHTSAAAAAGTTVSFTSLALGPEMNLKRISLDSCSRVTALGLKVLLDHCPLLQYVNAFAIQNLTILALQSLLKIASTPTPMPIPTPPAATAASSSSSSLHVHTHLSATHFAGTPSPGGPDPSSPISAAAVWRQQQLNQQPGAAPSPSPSASVSAASTSPAFGFPSSSSAASSSPVLLRQPQLTQLEIGGCIATQYPIELEQLRREFTRIKF